MKYVSFALAGLVCALTASALYAQVGNQNTTGASGAFNGQAGSCGYDPYTGNATRSITDMAVAGAIGEYPLALVRTANSRTPSRSEVFGRHGGWNHSYNWVIDDSPVTYTPNFPPVQYTVNFPDGRVETFQSVTWDTDCYRVRASAGGNASSAGVRERFVPMYRDPSHNLRSFLTLPDGGKVRFEAEQQYDPTYRRYWYKYHVTAIIDPYGLSTTIDSEVVGQAQIRRITRVTEPAGRYLQFSYATNRRISQVTEYINAVPTRTVQYNYIYDGWLDNVVYYGNNAWTARYQYTVANISGDLPLLLRTCDDPMYPGPMKRIAYDYKPGNQLNDDGTTPVYGQILNERYWDGILGHEASCAIVSTLTVGEAPNITWKRKETRGDSATRTFYYSSDGFVTWASDFAAHQSTFAYDPTYKYLTSFIDFNRNETNYVNHPITGNVTQVIYPLTPDDTPSQNTRPTVNYTYTNRYYLHTVEDEAGNLTIITRDPNNNRVTHIGYPDDGYEAFSYDPGHFYQLQSHQMVTGGTETWSYDARHRTDTYRKPDNASGNPTARYLYDNYDRVSSITDVLGASAGDGSHTTSFAYNLRGQLTFTTLSTDPVDNVRHTIRNSYNDTGNNAGDGTLVSVTNQLNHTTTYTYDDYRRLKSVTPPVRGNESAYTTNFYYDANGTGDDYRITDSNVTWVKFPSAPATKRIHTQYDDNRRTNSVTVAPGTPDEAATSYVYDGEGNVTWVTNPLNHTNVRAHYDQRNRLYEITVGPSHTTNIKYDSAGRTKEIDRPNGQVITYDSFDAMNRVTQQTATNTRGAGTQNIRTSYSYYPSGPANLLNTFQDPHLFGSSDQYTYTYDTMGRKRSLEYPLNSNGNHRTEQWDYDAVGRLYQFTNRDYPVKTQTFHYDALHRLTSFSWDDGGITPGVSFDYDAASRLTGITNANAVISRTYFNDNRLKSETETATGGVSRTVNYSYDADGNRASLGVPGYTFNYDYTQRNQLQRVINNANNGTIASYVYDVRGNMTLRSLVSNSTTSDYSYDMYDRVTSVNHNLASATRTIQYGYDDTNHNNNRLWAKRVIGPQSPEQNKGEVFSYDLADQVTAFQLNVLNPNQVSQPLTQTMLYDPNGNRQFTPMGQYAAANNLSQYTTRTIAGNQTTAAYEPKGNMTIGLDGSTYTYDAQSRLVTAAKNGVSMTFKYDGLNRQVKRMVTGGANPGTFFSVWDGWNLIEDYHKSGTNAVVDATYVYGATGLVRDMENPNHYYYQDASGSTSHVANNSGTLVEWYRYDLDGKPTFYDGTDHVRVSNQSGFNVRHLFTGQQWYQELGFYDLRNRFYSPDIGRFLQPDPIRFRGDRTNLYRYCKNNPVTRRDPFGLQSTPPLANDSNGSPGTPVERIIVDAPFSDNPADHPSFDPMPGFGPLGNPTGGGPGGEPGIGPHGSLPRSTNSNRQHQPPQQDSQTAGFDIYHPTTTAEFIIAGNIIEHGDTTDTTPAIDPIDLLSGGIAALLRSSFRSVLQKTAVFWAGGRAAEDAARTFAKASGGTVIADTAAGRALARSSANIPWSQARTQWVSLSEDFARNASGEVYVFQNARGVPLDSIWRNEYQILTRNRNVTGINFSVVMPDGSVVPVP